MSAFRFLLLVLLQVVFIGSISSCSKNEQATAVSDQELHIAIGASPQSLDPHVITGVPEMKVLAALSEPMLSLDLNTFEVKPGLAESWTISDDGLKYQFKLRASARWSNGEPLTAEDIVFSWRRAFMPSVGWQYATDFYFIKGSKNYHAADDSDPELLGVRALDAHTVEFELEYPYPLFLKTLTVEYIVPVHKATLLAHGAVDDVHSAWTKAGNFVGNGPFILKKWEINKVILLEKNPHYWGADQVKLDRIHLYPLETESAEERAFRSGQIQVAFGGRIPVDKIATYQEKQPDNLKIVNAFGIYNYYFNVNQPPFDDVRIRQALAHAIDREGIVKHITKAGEIVATTLTPPTPGYSEYVPKLEYDLSKAKALLAEAGYPEGKGFPTASLIYNTSDVHRKVALAIQQMWKTNLGIHIEMENQEWKVFLDTRQSHDFDIARAGSISAIGDPQDFLDSFKTGHGMNDTDWSNLSYDALLDQATQELDTNKRYQLAAQAEAILLEEMPLIPIYYYVYSYLVAEEVKGINFNSLSRIDYKTIYIQAP